MSRSAPHPVSLAEAARWLDAALDGRPVPPLLLVIGLGDGHLLDLLEQRAPSTRVLALEPVARAARAFFARGDWRDWLTTGRLVYLAGPDYAGADQAWRIFPDAIEAAPTVLTHPSVAARPTPEALRAAEVLRDILFGARANAAARRQFAPRYLSNTLRNAPAIAAGHDVRTLADAYRGVPAVIAAAGPSLDAVLAPLRAARERALVVAVDTALRPLLSAGVPPHLVVGLDPGERNARHFQALPPCPETWLVSESALDPSASAPFGARTFWFRVSDHHPWPWLRSLGVDVGQIDVWGSVVTAAFQIALLAGCDPIVFVGADLAYTDGRPYARGTTCEFEWAQAVADGADLHDIWRAWTAPVDGVRMPDLRGVESATSPTLLAFRDWLRAQAARSGRRVINATGAGMLFGEGIDQRELAEAILGSAAGPAPLHTIVRTRHPRDLRALAAGVRELRDTLGEAGTLRPLDEWRVFAGDAWDTAAMIQILDGASPASRDRAALDEPHEGDPAVAHLLRRLPEAVARQRALMRGQPVAPIDGTPPIEERVRLLVMAFGRLRQLGGEASDHADAAAPASATSPESAWSELHWRRLVFLALVACAWGDPSTTAANDSYWGQDVNVREFGPLDRSEAADTTTGADLVVDTQSAVAWALAVLSLDTAVSPPLCDRFRTAAPLLSRAAGAGHSLDRLILRVRFDEREDTVEAAIDGRVLARADTGRLLAAAVDDDRPGPPLRTAPQDDLLAVLDAGAASASVAVRRARVTRTALTARVLTDEGVPRAFPVYGTAAGVVCVRPWASESFVVAPDGSTARGQDWPRPILGELPWGRGHIAWNNGLADPASAAPSYVMYRPDGDAAPLVLELPFRPGRGVRFRDRVVWTCSLAGVGFWAPDTVPEFAFPDLSLVALVPEADGLLLSPVCRDSRGVRVRRLATKAARLGADERLETVALGVLGAPTSRGIGAEWTATAFPEADVVRFESSTGKVVDMVCYHPYQVAWMGDALLVGLFTGELLLFAGMTEQLAASSS